jgi:hypothetical protein
VLLSAMRYSIATQKEWWRCRLDGTAEVQGVENLLELGRQMGGL